MLLYTKSYPALALLCTKHYTLKPQFNVSSRNKGLKLF